MTVAADTASAVDSSTNPDHAGDLVTAMASLPVGHPSRPALRERAIEAWLPMARHLARRYANRGEPRDDLYQVAVVGLIKAIDRFATDRGVEFAGFAIPTIVGELKRHFRDKTWSVRVPRRLQELRLAISGADNALSNSLGRSPTLADIATYLEISEDEVIEGLEGARAYNSTSLSTPISEGGAELGETLGGEDTGFALAELRLALGPAMASLDTREQKIVSLRFYGNLTQQQIAEQIGISQMHVSRLLTRALAKLRRHLGSSEA
ncbi:RNA polymerase sigma factor SigF [Actinoplanes awajinensis]|uniref:RNA polymerase subunit sigma n=1 Tax=Actinoplanes awajinensis subsp. mycoplanecinus TaxID=135947 RepID=A0A101JF96_9ACTN|nr:RNA polymerase sigma factor SigF [Actinoplanes awajinensis]KUL25491.1 RNA polymerase subunit sigma [Actinoplanes awajinensis subsp. mycoplanecinus]